MSRNNEFKDFLSHIDMFNTINGGTSSPSIIVDKEDDRIIVRISAPAVNGDAFNLLLKGNQLIVYTVLSDEWALENADNEQKLPLFARTFDLPPFVDKEGIDAVFEDGNLNVVLPLMDKEEAVKKIDIRHY